MQTISAFDRSFFAFVERRISLDSIVYSSLIVGLYGSVTNLVYVSPVPSIVCLLLLPVYLYKFYKARIRTYVFVGKLYVYFAISLVSIMFYYPRSFLEFGFYRYDGTFIISYAPLLLAPFLRYHFSIDNKIKQFLFFATVINGIAFLLNVITTRFASILDWSNPETYYHAFFKSTNAAGGFISILLSLNILLVLREKKKVWYICFFFNSLFLLATTSRGSIMGLMLGFILYLLYVNNKNTWIAIIISIIVLVQLVVLYFSYPIFDQYIRDADLSDISVGEYIAPLFGQIQTKSANLVIRAVDTWPRGIDCFIHSPILGTGFGSINDIPLKYSNNFLVNFNIQPLKKFDDSHAHHSYIHILGEQGIVGLFIFLSFWKSVIQYISSQKTSLAREFMIISFFNLTLMSFTEHRIVSPSNALPFVIILSLFVMESNYNKTKKKYKLI